MVIAPVDATLDTADPETDPKKLNPGLQSCPPHRAAALPGQAIFIQNGTYREPSLTVEKSVQLIAEGDDVEAARPPEIVRKKHPEFDTEFDPVKVVRQAERDRLEKVSLEYREKERFLRPSHTKEEDVVEAIQRVAAPRKSHNKPLRPPPPRPLSRRTCRWSVPHTGLSC